MPRLLPLVSLLALAACLPSSQKETTRALTPGDSLSRDIAATVPVEALRLVWEAEAGPETPFQLPTTLAFLPDTLGGERGGGLVVADTRSGQLHRFADDGAYRGVWAEGFDFPYLVGLRGDTVAVHNRGGKRLDLVVDGQVVRRVLLAEDYTALVAGEGLLWAKRAEEGVVPFLARLDTDGAETDRFELPGPFWRHVGFLRVWDSTLVSLSGYRPVLDRLALDAPAGTAPDSLDLVGFDSPLLVRSFQYLIGEADQPPLLTSAATPLGDRLVVLNIRADAIRLDLYDAEGRLQRALEYSAPEFLRVMYPVDLAVQDGPDGPRFAVLLQMPGGRFQRGTGRVLVLEEANSPPVLSTP